MITVKSESTVMPQEWDTTSSPTTVYHNFNVVEVPAETENTGRARALLYQYDQQQYTRQEYTQYRLDKNEADIRYLAAQLNVPLQN